MILKSLKLENIRSHVNQNISFPTGSILLAGDIGAGKSSILLAIEFALFGIRRKHLTGEALLRNGKNRGSVELNFEINGKDVIIKRELVRKRSSVEQDKGFIIVNGLKKEGTPIELKAEVLDLLGYPKELLTKSKNLIYRYTVYCPQEEMKQILLDEEEHRLGTLRKVFGIDKYERIRENSSIVLKQIREEIKESQGMIIDLDEKINRKKELEQEVARLKESLERIIPKLEPIKKEVEEKRKKIKDIELKQAELNKLKKELAVIDAELNAKIDQRSRNKIELERLEKDISLLKKSLEGKEELKAEKILAEIKQKELQIQEKERGILEITRKINELQVKKRHSEGIKDRITKLQECPTCEQKVEEEHKAFIINRENKNIEEFNQKLKSFSEEENKLKLELNSLKKELEELKKKENQLEVIEIRMNNLKEKTEIKNRLLKEQDELKAIVGQLNIKKLELNKKLGQFKTIDEESEQLRKELDSVLLEEKKLEIEKISIQKEIEGVNKILADLEKEIELKLKTKEKVTRLSELKTWLESYFVNLMSIIEKQIMLKVHYDFNSAFQEWFNCLIEDEGMVARLDNGFSPIIEQNGYEVNVSNLSGGERTACALAYRLSLNKTINDLIGGIKTKDLIILDEPTDGFSNEQLDKVRNVLDQLNVHQIILVSHESKIESFVDHIIRIGKHENSSFIV